MKNALVLLLVLSHPWSTRSETGIDRYLRLSEEVNGLRVRFRDNRYLVAHFNTPFSHLREPLATAEVLGQLLRAGGEMSEAINRRLRQMEQLKKTVEVRALSGSFGNIREVDALLEDVFPFRVAPGHWEFFADDEGFEVWNGVGGGLDTKAAYYARRSAYISRCLDNVRIGEEASIFNMSYTCNQHYSNITNYTLRRDGSLIALEASIALDYRGEGRADEAFGVIRQTMPCVEDFFARHGIRLRLTLKEGYDLFDWFVYDHVVELVDYGMFATSNKWVLYLNHHDGRVEEEKRCLSIAHELGHNFGLRDGYLDANCPEREVTPPDDIMHSVYGTVAQTRLYPYDVRRLLKPLCGR